MQQNSCVSLPPQSLRLLRALFFCVLLHSCSGQHDSISSRQPIVARVGDDIMLPCHLEPAMDVAAKTLEWTRPDLNNVFVYVWRSGQEFVKAKHPSYTGRTSLFTDEMQHGNMSLKLSEVKLSDMGTYKCFIPELGAQSTVEVVVAIYTAAPPVITLSGVDKCTSGVVLRCESKGWYPETEVLWLDGEEHVLAAESTETVRGPDDLYTVSSTVSVDKRHGHRFTCRVQQNIINQTRETHIDVSDEFFNVQSSQTKKKRVKWQIVSKQRFKEEKQRRQEAERKVQKLMEELKTERDKVKLQIVSKQRFKEEKQRRQEAERKVESLMEELKTETDKMLVNQQSADARWKETNKKLEQAERVLDTKMVDLDQTKRHLDQLLAENKKLTEEKQRCETERQQLQPKRVLDNLFGFS